MKIIGRNLNIIQIKQISKNDKSYFYWIAINEFLQLLLIKYQSSLIITSNNCVINNKSILLN